MSKKQEHFGNSSRKSSPSIVTKAVIEFQQIYEKSISLDVTADAAD